MGCWSTACARAHGFPYSEVIEAWNSGEEGSGSVGETCAALVFCRLSALTTTCIIAVLPCAVWVLPGQQARGVAKPPDGAEEAAQAEVEGRGQEAGGKVKS